MRKMKLNKALSKGKAILLLLLIYGTSFGQITWNSMVAANVSTICSDGEPLLIDFSTTLTGNIDVEIQLGTGMEYIPSSLILTGATLVTDNTTDSNNPKFTLNLTSGAVTLGFDRIGGCSSQDYQIGGGVFNDVAKIFQSGVQEGVDRTSNNYQVQYASLSITGLSNDPSTGTVGTTVSRSMTINNGAFGFVSEFTFAEIITPGDLSFSNFVINPSGVNYVIPASNISLSTGGDSLIVVFDQTAINNITNTGSDVDLFEQGETFVLQYDMTFNTCGASNNIQSTQTVFWGCDDTYCQNYEQLSSVPLLLGQPNLSVEAVVGSMDQCYGYDNSTILHTVKIINTGSGQGIVNTTRFQFNYGYVAGYDPNDVVYNFNGGVDAPIAASSTVTSIVSNYPSCLSGIGANLVSQQQWDNLPIIPAGDTLELKFELYTCCPTECAPLDYTESVTYGNLTMRGMIYTNQCGENLTAVGNKFLTTNRLNIISSNTLPANMIANAAPQNVNLELSTLNWTSTIVNPANAYFELEITFPGQIDFGGSGVGDISWVDANGDVFIPSYSDIREDGMTIRWSGLSDTNRNGGGLIYPIVADCSEVATDDILQSHFYLYPNTGCTNDCRIELSCNSEVLNIVCPGTCVAGISNISYKFERTNLGEIDMDNNGCPDTDNDCDGVLGGGSVPPTADYSYIRKDKAISGDTIISSVVGAVSTNVSYPSWDYVYYENNFNDIANWNFISATLEVYDFSNASTISIPSGTLTPIITGNQVKFDLSTTGSIASFLPVGFQFENSDSLKLDITYQVLSSSFTSELLSTDNFFYTSDIVNPPAPTSFECSKFIGKINASKLNVYSCCTYDVISDDCSVVNTFNDIRAELNGGYAGQQTFSYEYRNLFKPTFFSYVVPHGYIIEDVTFKTDRATSGNLTTTQATNYVIPTDSILNVDGSILYEFDLTDPVNLGIFTENGGNLFLSDEGHVLTPKVNIRPICAKGEDHNPSSVFLGILTNNNSIETTTDIYSLKEQLPELTITSTNAFQTINGREVIWDISINNTSTIGDVSNNWLYIEIPNGNIGANVLELSEGGVPIVPNSNGIYQLGSISVSGSKNLSLKADVQLCDLNSVIIKTGYNCTGYPNEISDYVCEPLAIILGVEIAPSQVSTLITALANTPSDPSDASSLLWGRSAVDMCDPFPVEVRIISSQPGEITNLITKLNNLVAGGGPALDFISNSGYIEYPVGTTPRAFSTSANTLLVGEIGATQYNFDLAVIDPVNFHWASSTGLVPGVGDTPNNEIVLRFQMATNCSLLSGDALTFSSTANRPCGMAAIGNGELISAYDIKIDGVLEPYNINFLSLSADDIERCTGQSTVVTSFEKTGTATVTTTDSLQFILPEGTTFAGPINCMSGVCPTGSPSVTTVAGLQKISWQLPALLNGETGEFSFTIDYSDISTCGVDIKELQASGVSDQTITCGGLTCSSSKISLGQESESISYFKPILEVTFNSLSKTPGSPNHFEFDVEVENNGIIGTSSPIKIDFYEYDLNNHNITGSRLARFSSPEALGAGGSENITGFFDTVNELPDGVVVIIDRGESSNCTCPNFSGIDDNPAAIMSPVTLPVELSLFRGESKACQVELTWRSETEELFSHYELQKSSDGRYFETIEVIEGSGGLTLSQSYRYLDKVSLAKNYYRLRLVDLDGSVDYSEVVFIETDCDKAELTFHPNPASQSLGVIDINLKSSNSTEQLEIINITGVLVKQLSLELNPNKVNSIRIAVDDLAVGSYYLKIAGTKLGRMLIIQ